MTDPLSSLWPYFEVMDPTIEAHVVAQWPPGTRERLVGLGFLREAENAQSVLCPECQSHFEEVLAIGGPNGRTRLMIACPEVYRAEVPVAALRQWKVDSARFADTLADSLDLTGQCTELAPNRVWRLGRTKWQGKSRDVLLGRCLGAPDAAQFRRVITAAHRPIVFVGAEAPATDFWQGKAPPLIRLCEIATLANDRIEFDLPHLAELITAANEGSAGTQPIMLDQLVRRQVKAELKITQRDDWLLSGVLQCGSYRKAAEFLTDQSGQKVSKDMVQRAVARAGGLKAVARGDDSDSVERSRTSQRRDTPIKKEDSYK